MPLLIKMCASCDPGSEPWVAFQCLSSFKKSSAVCGRSYPCGKLICMITRQWTCRVNTCIQGTYWQKACTTVMWCRLKLDRRDKCCRRSQALTEVSGERRTKLHKFVAGADWNLNNMQNPGILKILQRSIASERPSPSAYHSNFVEGSCCKVATTCKCPQRPECLI